MDDEFGVDDDVLAALAASDVGPLQPPAARPQQPDRNRNRSPRTNRTLLTRSGPLQYQHCNRNRKEWTMSSVSTKTSWLP